jgi:MFS family permease
MDAPWWEDERRERWQTRRRLASFQTTNRSCNSFSARLASRHAPRNDSAVASIARNGGVAKAALTNTHFLLLYCAMLVASSGNTALQSIMPAIGREIGIRDFYVAIAYTWSAVLWVLLAPYWAEKSDHHGRKTLTMMGISGFVLSMTLCGIALFCGLHHAIGGALTFGLFAAFRAIYGGLGCATPSATQAYLASKTRRSGRVAALSALSSSFGLGTIIGPAVAPLFVVPIVGLAGPLFAFARLARWCSRR